MPLLTPSQDYYMGEELYKLLPQRYRSNDHSPLLCTGESEELKFCERLFRVFGDNLDVFRNAYIDFLNQWNPRKCDEDMIAYLAQNHGWSMDDALDTDFQRILLQNIKLVYNLAGRSKALWYLIYAHTGINTNVRFANDENALEVNFATYLTAEYTGGYYIDVNSTGPIEAGDKIWQQWGQRKSHTIVDSYPDIYPANRIYLTRPFSYSMPAGMGSRIIHNRAQNKCALPGVGGRNLFLTGTSITDCNDILGRKEKRMSAADRRLLLTAIITWPFEPSTAQKAIAESIIQYCLSGRCHYSHIYKSRTQNDFYSDFSRTDLRDRV